MTDRPDRGAPIWLLVLITISGTLAMHMFAPALPDAARHFGASMATMQLTISTYMLGLACGQLIYGPLSDGLGRRPMLLAGLCVYTMAGVVAALATSVDTLIVARLFQALGGCAGLALGRAMVRDTSRPDETMRALALLNLMITVGPGLAPLLGSQLTVLFGWRAVLVALVVLGAVTLLCTWRLLPETGRPSGHIRFATMARDYGILLRSPVFMGFAVGGGCIVASLYAFIAAAPFIISLQLHRPLHEVGIYLGLLIIGGSLGSLVTRYLVGRVRSDRVLIGANLVSLSSGATLLAVALAGTPTVSVVVGLMFLFTLGAAAASPVGLSRALDVDAGLVGSAAGLYGFMQMAIGALGTIAVGLGDNPTLAAASVLTVATLLGLCCNGLALARARLAAT